jgi:hypothetical protein
MEQDNLNKEIAGIIFNVKDEPRNLSKIEIKEMIAKLLGYGQHTINVYLLKGKDTITNLFGTRIEQDPLLQELINLYYSEEWNNQ